MDSSRGPAEALLRFASDDGIRPPRAEVRLLGGFEVRVDGRPVSGFESQKVRGLLAYLAMSRGVVHGRERLAELFWPEHEPVSARSSLRQALYNLRSTLAPSPPDPGWQPIVSTHQTVTFSRDAGVWVDVEAFEEALRRGTEGAHGSAVHLLSRAVQLYQGDFLSGCPVRGGTDLDAWISEQQERLREAAIQALRTLISCFRERGDHRLSIQHAQRLLSLDPLAEEAHRQLMSLYSLSGRRGRALSQYEDLRHLLDRELGVEPEEETHALYQAILKEEQVAGERGEDMEPVGPIIPLVGREPELAALRRTWAAVQRGSGAFTLLEGEPGVGKSRLAKTFLCEVERSAAVLLARCQGFEPEIPYQPIRDALRNGVGEETDAARLALAGAPAGLAAEVARLLPELGVPDAPPAAVAGDPAARDRLADAVWQVLRRLTALAGRRSARPVLVLLEDLHLADRTTLGLLERLLPRLSAAPVWILATAATGWRVEAVDPLAHLRPEAQKGREGREGREAVCQVFLDRLDETAVRQIARKLVGAHEAGDLARLYLRYAGGLPLAIAELTNLLADEGVLVRSARGGWTATSPLARVRLPETSTLQEVILRRVSRLPTSTRRLLVLGAVLGHGFDALLLREVEREHITVVECALEVLLDRWLVRHATSQWHASRRERDIVLWANGARRGSFEFSHEIVRRTIYDSLNRTRRRVLHRQVAEVLEQRAGDDRESCCELLAYHYARAGAWDRTVGYLKMASERAFRLSIDLPPLSRLGFEDEVPDRVRRPS
jgi:DNA-binding SARP family transcriptional activator